MKYEQVLPEFKAIEIDDTNTTISFGAEFCAVGRAHNYYYGYDHTTEKQILAIGSRSNTLEETLKSGTILSFGSDTKNDQGYQRAILVERSLLAGLPLDDALRLTSGISNYEALDQLLGDSKDQDNKAPISKNPFKPITPS